jgi:hypothetical protein
VRGLAGHKRLWEERGVVIRTGLEYVDRDNGHREAPRKDCSARTLVPENLAAAARDESRVSVGRLRSGRLALAYYIETALAGTRERHRDASSM